MARPTCEVCGKPVRANGVVAIRSTDADGLMRRWDAFVQEHPGAHNFVQAPDNRRAHWYWGHGACLPAKLDYSFEGSRIRNSRQALGWTLHLAEKHWFSYTDWDHLMRRFGFVEYS